ncbi:hypothetical protein Taro_050285, partial [Colocasia esculenta]|nr:hypothetical protein [Colocasia esculenta]
RVKTGRCCPTPLKTDRGGKRRAKTILFRVRAREQTGDGRRASTRLWLCRVHDAASPHTSPSTTHVCPTLYLLFLSTPSLSSSSNVCYRCESARSPTPDPVPPDRRRWRSALRCSPTRAPPPASALRPGGLVREVVRFRISCVDTAAKSASNTNDDSGQAPKETQMTVSITGATGFIGRKLVQKLLEGNHEVRVLTRSKAKAQLVFPAESFPKLNIAEEHEWKQCIQGSTAVVNLAGMPISTRWSPEVKKEVKESRIRVTSKVVDLINTNHDAKPSVLVSATAVGYYGTSETKVFDERSPSGNDYLSEVCREWEARAVEVDKDVRLALIRIGVVLGKEGGALAKMIPFFMMFAGGPLGTGRQWFSWIHLDDLVNLIIEALENPSYKGIINGTAPNPVRLSEMCEKLGEAMGRPSWLPVPELALKAMLGEGSTVVLQGQKVLPSKAQELGFSFKYPYIRDALRAIMS